MSKKGENKMTFAELSSQWLLSVSYGIKESTLYHYRYTLNRYILPVFGIYKVQTLGEQQLESGILRVISPEDGSHLPLGGFSGKGVLDHPSQNLQVRGSSPSYASG